MAKSKAELMKETRTRLRERGLVPFSGWCKPETLNEIKALEEEDRFSPSAPSPRPWHKLTT